MRVNFILASLLSLALILSSCAATEVSSYSSHSFGDIDELVEYISANNEVLDKMQKAYPTEYSDKAMIYLFIPSVDEKNLRLSEIELIGDNIYYTYFKGNYNPGDEPSNVNDSKPGTENSNASSEPAASEKSAQDITDGDIIITMDTVERLENIVTIGWNYTGNGNEGLNEFIATNPEFVHEFEEYPGIYYSKAPKENLEYGRMIYWVQDGYFCEAYAPLPELASLLSKITSVQENKLINFVPCSSD